MKRIFMYILMLIQTGLLQAQTAESSLSGNITDEKREEIVRATVSLLNSTDSTVTRIVLSGNKGQFRFDTVKPGSYILKIAAANYNTYYSFPVNITQDKTIMLPVIVLLGKVAILAEVTVSSKKQMVEQDIDKTVVNVDAMVGSPSFNTLEILARSPGVTVNENGSVNLNGKTNALVLIDGRPTYMSSQDLAAYLKSIPGGMLDKIELVDNPSARYDAEGGAVVNVRLKKTKKQGVTGNISSGFSQGVYARANELLGLNYNKEKFSLMGSFIYSRGADYGDTYNHRVRQADNSLPYSEIQLSKQSATKNNSYLSKLGFDYYLSKKTTLGVQVSAQSTPATESNSYASSNFSGASIPDSIVSGNSFSTAQWKNLSVNANLQHKLNAAGSELTADLNYITFGLKSQQPFNNFVAVTGTTKHPTDAFLYNLLFNKRIYNFKADYTLPIDAFIFEAGIKSSLVRNDNDFRYFNTVNSQSTQDLSRSDHFFYQENINAGYVNLKQNAGRFRWQLGVRLENTQLEGKQPGNSAVTAVNFAQHYTDVFPNISLQYQLDSAGKNRLSLSISKRINRPSYYQYNPFVVFNDRYSYSSGNPQLQPSYPNSIELSLQHKQLLTIRAGYGKNTGSILQATEIVNDIFLSRPENLGKEETFFGAVVITLPARKWWRLNANVRLHHSAYEGIVSGNLLHISVSRFRLTAVNQFTLGKNWTADLSFEYLGQEFQNQAYRLPRQVLSGGVQKKILGGKGSIALGFEDFLHSLKSNYRFVNTQNVNATQTFDFDSQRIRFSFNYSFGQDLFKRKSMLKENAAEPEIQRANN